MLSTKREDKVTRRKGKFQSVAVSALSKCGFSMHRVYVRYFAVYPHPIFEKGIGFVFVVLLRTE